jgi:hypothetical protein
MPVLSSSTVALGSVDPSKHALLVNTHNDFPLEENGKDVDGFPGQVMQAYWALRRIGYDDKQITLLLHHDNDAFIDNDGDCKNDMLDAEIDSHPWITKSKIRAEIERVRREVEPYGELLIYLVDHGQIVGSHEAALCFESGELLNASEFSQWLDSIFCKKIIVLADFCYSGDFIKPLVSAGRTCVSSTSEGEIGWYYWDSASYLSPSQKDIFGNSGSVFFHPFWKRIGEGASIEEAFQFASTCYGQWKDIVPRSKETIDHMNPKIYHRERSFFETIIYEISALFRYVFGKVYSLTLSLDCSLNESLKSHARVLICCWLAHARQTAEALRPARSLWVNLR